MAFRDELRPASFRGIAFDLVDDDAGGGRRYAQRVYPGRDGAGHEDMGGAPRVFSFRAVVMESGFVGRAKAFEDALNKPGAGSLVHPHYGELRVVVPNWTRNHAISQIGEVSFNVSVEVNDIELGGLMVANDTARQLSLTSGGMFDLAGQDFLDNLAQGLFPGYVTQDGLSRMRSMVSTAQGLFTNYGLPSSFAAFNADSLFSFAGLDGSLVGRVMGLFKDTASAARTQVSPAVGSTSAAPTESVDQVKMVKAFASLSDTSVDSNIEAISPSRAAMVQNAAAITAFMQTNALAAAGTAARYATYDSQQHALEVRDMLTTKLVDLRTRQLTAGMLPAARATTDMLVAVTEDINDKLGRLPRTIRIQSKTVRPSLAISNRLYGSNASTIFDLADDMVTRNRLAHPGFVSVKPMEVLIDG